MPKIIENLREKLVREAQYQVEERGYSALTIRSVANACGVGVGTVYNYFASKDALVAAFMLEDWQKCMDAVTFAGQQAQSPQPVLECMHTQLRQFTLQYQSIFADKAALASFSDSPSPYHSLLRSQMAQPLRAFTADDFTAEFIAEALLTWTVAGRSFEEIDALIEKII